MTSPSLQPTPLVPDYGGRCVSEIVPQLLRVTKGEPVVDWVSAAVGPASRVVLLVIDGLGWEQLASRSDLAPTLASMAGGSITTTVPSTTPACLTSIITGRSPAEHGMVGLRIAVGYKQILDVKHWTIDGFDARQQVPPGSFQMQEPFRGVDVPSVIRGAFIGGALTAAQFGSTSLHGYALPSSMPVQVRSLLDDGAPLVYAYYDGLDVVAHLTGLGDEYEAELRATDRLVADMLAALPPDVALVVTADHGHVAVESRYIEIDQKLIELCTFLTGEARLRWLHVSESRRSDALALAHELYDDIAWVRSADEVIDENWLGGRPSAEIRRRIGDICIAPFAPVGLIERTGSAKRLLSHHGSLTSAEINVPFIGATA